MKGFRITESVELSDTQRPRLRLEKGENYQKKFVLPQVHFRIKKALTIQIKAYCN